MKKLIQIIKYLNNHPLSGRHKLKAYCRFLFWQISQLLFPHEAVVTFAGNTKLVAKKGMTGATGNIYTGLHEFEEMAFLLHFLREADLFADIGANIGSYSILASGYVHATTLAFEPIPTTYEILKKNIAINHLNKKVTAFNIALGGKEAIQKFTSSLDTVNHALASEEENGLPNIAVKVTTFDSFVAEYGYPSLIKIDVEGYETEVLKGMSQTLRNNDLKSIIIELNGSGERYGFDENLIHEKLLSNNFLLYQYNPYKRELINSNNFGSFNSIYIRDLNFVQERINAANKINVFSESF